MICKYFSSHSISCLFILLMVSFIVQKLFKVVPLVYFCFCCLFFWCQIKKSLPRSMSRSLPPTFSSKSFMVSGLIFKSLIHLRLVLGLPWWCSGWESACQCRGHRSGKIPHAAEQLSLCATTAEPVLWSPRATTAGPTHHNY